MESAREAVAYLTRDSQDHRPRPGLVIMLRFTSSRKPPECEISLKGKLAAVLMNVEIRLQVIISRSFNHA